MTEWRNLRISEQTTFRHDIQHPDQYFLSTGTPPSTEEPYDVYPIVVAPDYDSSATVLVVQDYTFGKYLGRLDVKFDEEGKLTEYGGNPIFLDNSVEQGKEAYNILSCK